MYDAKRKIMLNIFSKTTKVSMMSVSVATGAPPNMSSTMNANRNAVDAN